MSKVTYKENQKFRKWDMILLLLVLISGVGYRLAQSLLIGADNNTAMMGLVLLSLVGLLLYALNVRLRTKVTTKGIQFQYFPLHYKSQKIAWNQIQACEIIETPLVAQLSGWGINNSLQERAFSLSGRTGLRLTLNSGEKIFIGTQNPKRLFKVMKYYTDKLDK